MYLARQAYKEQDVSNIGFVRSNYNIADELTKTKNREALRNFITTKMLSIKVDQWIIRKPIQKDEITNNDC